MNQRERNALDRHITGNYGEDQFEQYDEPEPTEEQMQAEMAAEEEHYFFKPVEQKMDELLQKMQDAKKLLREDRTRCIGALEDAEDLMVQLMDCMTGRNV
jgi:hypothetical protein